jgi:ECF transporter S component (folate family)
MKLSPNARHTTLRNIRVLTGAALLTAVSFVLAYLAKSIFGTGPIRITLENLPIFFGSILFGPVIGMIIAVGADLLSCLQSGMTPNLIVAVGAALIGSLSGVLYRYVLAKQREGVRLFLTVFLSHLLGSMIVKSFGLYLYFGWAILYRIPIYIGISIIEALLLRYLTGSQSLMRQIGKVTK